MVMLFLGSWLEAQTPSGAPVQYRGEVLFRIHTRVGSFPPEERAKAVADRMERLTRNPFAEVAPLRIVDGERTTDIYSGDLLLASVTDDDAATDLTGRVTLAHTWAAAIRRGLETQTLFERVESLALSSLISLGILVGLWFLFAFTRRLAEKGRLRLEAIPDEQLPSLRWQKLILLSPAQDRQLILGFLKISRWVVNFSLTYFCLGLAFSLFPWTRGLAARLLEAVFVPLSHAWNAFLDYVPNLLVLALILVAARYALKLLRFLSEQIRTEQLNFPGFYPEWAEPTYKLVRTLVFASTLIIAFPYLPGSNSEAFKGVTIFAGIVFSLGSTGLVGNLLAGVMLIYMRAFRLGDRIQVGDTIGDVMDCTLLVTRLRTIKNVDIIIPNSTLLGSQVHNYSANAPDRGLILHSTVTIGYDAPWRTVHRLLIDAAKSTEGILHDPEPFVLQTSLDDFYVSYQINAYTRLPLEMANLYSALHVNIQEQFNEAGVEIMSPHYRAGRDGNAIAIPESYRPANYRAPGFRVENISENQR
jgi:small-conductance mechanosensitive channel